MSTWQRLTELRSDWTPTAANINALPYPLRRFIYELETADGAIDTRRRIELEDLVLQLQALVADLHDE